jgi:hypothetical protein
MRIILHFIAGLREGERRAGASWRRLPPVSVAEALPRFAVESLASSRSRRWRNRNGRGVLIAEVPQHVQRADNADQDPILVNHEQPMDFQVLP